MADIVTQGDKLSITLTMYRADDDSTKTRTFSIDNPVIDETGEQFRQKLQALQNFFLGDGATLIQPTGWRDNDSTENEYVTTAVSFETASEVGTKWDTKLSRNLQLSQSTFSYANLPTDPADEGALATITFDGDADISDFQVSHNLVGAGPIWWTWYATQEANPIYKFEIIKGVIEGYNITGTITISLPASGVYQEGSVTITITE